MQKFKKKLPVIPYKEFKKALKELTHIISSHGVRYDVKEVTKNEITFERHQANKIFDWSVEIKALYTAYVELDSFESIAFKKYLPAKYQQGRVILFHLGLLEVIGNA
jgi:hypothetical protein